MNKFKDLDKINDIKKFIMYLHMARANIAVVDLSGTGKDNFIEDVIVPAFRTVTVIYDRTKPPYCSHTKVKPIEISNLEKVSKYTESVVVDDILTPDIIKHIIEDEITYKFTRSYVLTYKAKSIEEFVSKVGECIGDSNYVKWKDLVQYRGNNFFDIIVTIDTLYYNEDGEPIYDIVGLYGVRPTAPRTDEELVELIKYSELDGYYDILSLPDIVDLKFRCRASGSYIGRNMLKKFTRVFLNW